MAFSLFRRAARGEISLVFDVGSDTVGGALVEFASGVKPRVLYATREQITFQKNLEPGRFLELMHKTFEDAVLHIEKYGMLHVSRGGRRAAIANALCTLSSPWHASRVKTIRLKEEKPVTVTSRLIKTLLEKEAADAAGEFSKDKEASVALIERQVVECLLNGYPTGKPIGKRAGEVEISLFLSFAPQILIDRIGRTLEKHFGLSRVEFRSFLLTSFVVLRDLLEKNGRSEPFLLFHVGGELTEISLIEKGVIVETVSFPLGHNFLIRNIAAATNDAPAHVAAGLLKLYAKSGGSGAAKAAVEQAERDWLALLKETFSTFSEELYPSGRFVLLVEDEYAPIFAGFLKKADFGERAGANRDSSITVFDRSLLKEHSLWEETVPYDSLLGLESVFHAALRNAPDFSPSAA